MSINDLQNINNFRQTHQYIQVNSANINKQMSEEQNLFDTTPKKYSNQNTNELFLFPSPNEYLMQKNDEFSIFPAFNQYDDENSAKLKSKTNFFL